MIVYPGHILNSGGGGARAVAMCRAVRDAGMQLSLVSRDTDLEKLLALGIFDETHLFKSACLVRLRAQDTARSHLVRNMDVEFDDYVLDVVRKNPPHAIICHFAWTARVLAQLPSGITGILDTHDIQYRRGIVAHANGVKNFDRQSGKREELRELRKVQVLVAIQPEEQKLLQELLPGQRVICATHSIPVNPLGSPEESRSVFFVGSNYDPNIRGIERFVLEAWPRIREAVPAATLDICGKVCESIYHLQSTPGIRFHGVVDDLESYYKKAAVVVNPSLYGTGLPIKTSEALAYGKCLVCNESSARGFDRDTFPGLICDYEQMSEHIIPLLEDLHKRRERESIAKDYAKRFMVPEVVYKDLVDVLHEASNKAIACSRVSVPEPGLFSRLRNYPRRKVFYYYAAALLSRFFQRSGGGGLGGRFLEKYVQLRWRALARDEGIRRVAVFGAGKHSYWLMHVLREEPDVEVTAVLDDHPAADREGPFHLVPVLSRTFDPGTVDAIILSSDCIQDKLARRCRELYGQDVRVIDLYEGLPPGPYDKTC